MNEVATPYELLTMIDKEMAFSVFDPERFRRMCVARELVARDAEDIAEAVGAFIRGTEAA